LSKSVRIIAADCETDPFKHERAPVPFIWGAYDGKDFRTFRATHEFVKWARAQKAIIYFHNGGKFDAMFLLYAILESAKGEPVRAQIINGRVVKIKLGRAEIRDSYAAVPEPLVMIGKKEIDYAKLEKEVREENMPEIIDYLKQDCVSLFDLMVIFRKIVGTKLTIASNALTYCRDKLKVDPGKTNAHFDGLMREFYYGGRTECFRPGTHINISVADIVSSYPRAMMEDHPTGSERVHITDNQFYALSEAEQNRTFIRIDCETLFGCFPSRAKGGGLEFPVRSGIYSITGWEYITARKFGMFRNEKILEAIVFPRVINFSPYIDHWFAYKAAHNKETQPIEYLLGKRMQNALYGKMAQDPARYYDYLYCEGGSEIDRENGWELADEYQGIEVHRREALWKYRQEFGDDWRGRPLYNNVATGASITGFARANLLKGIMAVGKDHVIYTDTDSLICSPEANMSALTYSKKLGDWELELDKSPIGHFVGKKTYGIDTGKGLCNCGDDFKKCKRHKIASKGSKLTFSDIERLTKGEIIVWNNKAPSFSIAGEPRFVSRSIRSTAKKPLEFHKP
jgi:hypothetical protein